MAEHIGHILDAAAADIVWTPELEQVALGLIENSAERLYVAQFIVAATTGSDAQGRVRELLSAITRAHRRGVDVRVLLSPFRSDEDPFDINLVAAAVLTDGGVPTRSWSDPYRESMHSKYIVHDDTCVLIGSANWSSGGLSGNIEAAAVAWSTDAANLLGTRFRRAWDYGVELEPLP